MESISSQGEGVTPSTKILGSSLATKILGSLLGDSNGNGSVLVVTRSVAPLPESEHLAADVPCERPQVDVSPEGAVVEITANKEAVLQSFIKVVDRGLDEGPGGLFPSGATAKAVDA